MTKCQACGATYNQVQGDGLLYFHRCPPLSLPELVAAVAAGKVAMVNGETPSVAITLRSYERNAFRDENLPGTKAGDSGKVKANGAGVTTVADPAPIVVVALP
jgi:hypothetical protein